MDKETIYNLYERTEARPNTKCRYTYLIATAVGLIFIAGLVYIHQKNQDSKPDLDKQN